MMAAATVVPEGSEYRPRVLLVDDECHVTDALWRSLRKDFDVDIANSGRMALNTLLLNEDIDVMVLDVTMPYYDAVELLFDLEKKKRFPKIIFISGWCAEILNLVAGMAEHLEFDVLGHFEKPVPAATISGVVKSAMARAAC